MITVNSSPLSRAAPITSQRMDKSSRVKLARVVPGELDPEWAEFLPLASVYHARRKKLIARYLPYAHKLADRMRRRLPGRVSVDAVRSEAAAGLMESIDRYDGRVKFETFATPRILGQIKSWVRAELRHVHLSLEELAAELDD
jgi:hypothetical protein